LDARQAMLSIWIQGRPKGVQHDGEAQHDDESHDRAGGHGDGGRVLTAVLAPAPRSGPFPNRRLDASAVLVCRVLGSTEVLVDGIEIEQGEPPDWPEMISLLWTETAAGSESTP
jgi:hypothetical protein